MSEGRNHNNLGILFEIFLNAYPVSFFCKYYTFQGNDLLFNNSPNCLRILVSFHYLPRIYPNYLDLILSSSITLAIVSSTVPAVSSELIASLNLIIIL